MKAGDMARRTAGRSVRNAALDVRDLRLDPFDPDTLYAGTDGGSVYEQTRRARKGSFCIPMKRSSSLLLRPKDLVCPESRKKPPS